MQLYLNIILIVLILLFIYEGYRYYAFKFHSVLVKAIIKSTENHKVFQRPSTKMLEGEKRAVKVGLEYTYNHKSYKKTDRIALQDFIITDQNHIKLYILKHNPAISSIKSHRTRAIRFVIASCALTFWSIMYAMV